MKRKFYPAKPFAAALSYFLDHKPRKHMTQKWIAEKANVTQSFISGLKRGDYDGSETVRRAIADLYGYQYDEFLNFGNSLILVQDRQDPARTPVDTETVLPWSENGAGKLIPIDGGLNGKKIIPDDSLSQYIDQDAVRQARKLLLEIQDYDPNLLYQVWGYIHALHTEVMKKKKKITVL